MKTIFAIVALLVAIGSVTPICVYEPVTANAFVSATGDGVYCNDIQEDAQLGESVCEFVVSGAIGILIHNVATPNIEDHISLSVTATSTLLVRVIVRSGLTFIVDTASPVDALTGDLYCTNTEAQTDVMPFTLTIQEVNNRDPQFDQSSYDIRGVNRTLAPGTDLTELYNVTIFAFDNDNSINPTESNIILAQITDYKANFDISIEEYSASYPKTYQIRIFLKEATFLNIATTLIQITNPVGQVFPTETVLSIRFLD